MTRSPETAFDNVAPLVGAFVEAVEGCSVGFVWNDGLCAAIGNVGPKVVVVIALISNESAHRRSKREKGRGGNVCVLPGREMICAGSAIRIAQRVDFRGASAA
jgi:hypothetical protein